MRVTLKRCAVAVMWLVVFTFGVLQFRTIRTKGVTLQGSRTTDVQANVKDMQGNVKDRQGNVKDMQGNVKDMQGNVKDMQGNAKDMQGNAKDVQGNAKDMQGNVKDMQGNAKDMQGNAKDVQGNAKDMQGNVKDMQGNGNDMQGNAKDMQGNVKDMQGNVKDVREDHMENHIVARNKQTSKPGGQEAIQQPKPKQEPNLDTLKQQNGPTHPPQHARGWKGTGSLFVYSAYYDGRRDSVLVISLVENVWRPLHCGLWYEREKTAVRVHAKVERHSDSHQKRFFSVFIRCTNNQGLSVPQYVSVFSDPKVEPEDMSQATNLLPVITVQESPQPKRRHNFTVCVSPLFNNIDPDQLVEFIEVSRLFGADHFILYSMLAKAASAQPYLEYYVQKGLVSVYDWNLMDLGVERKEVKNHGQVAALNNCLYQSMYSSKYLVLIDLDELIVPIKATSWAEMLSEASRGHSADVGSFSFQCVFFKTEWPSDRTFENMTAVTKYNLKTLLKTYREHKIWPHRSRSKVIVVPERIRQLGIHTVDAYLDAFRGVDVPQTSALLFHYRNWSKPDSPLEVTDRRMHVFAERIVNRVKQVHDEMGRN